MLHAPQTARISKQISHVRSVSGMSKQNYYHNIDEILKKPEIPQKDIKGKEIENEVIQNINDRNFYFIKLNSFEAIS